MLTGAVFVAVAAPFGGVAGPGILGALAAAVLTGAAVAALVTAYAAKVELSAAGSTCSSGSIVIPITLFSGTFFPVDQLPAVVRPLAWISPLWHGTELARAAALDRWALLPALGHLAFLGALLAFGVGLAGPAVHPTAARSDAGARAWPLRRSCCVLRARSATASRRHLAARSSPASSSPSSTCSRSGRASGRWSGRSRARTAPRSATPRSSRRASWRRRR